MRIKVRWFPGGEAQPVLCRAPSNILTFSLVQGGPVLLRNLSGGSGAFRRAGPLMFRPRASVWESRMNGSRLLTVSSYFDEDFLSPDAEPEGIAVDDFAMLEMMQLLHDEVRQPGGASADLVQAIGSALRIKLARLMRQPGASAKPVGLGMIRHLIEPGHGSIPKVNELAALCHTSRRTLLRRLKTSTGKSPSRHVAETKLNRAKMLLATSQMTLKQIAYEAGYATASNFSSRFKALTGMTPTAFRASARRRHRDPGSASSGRM
jgi:AraC-like DNA-binding protein